MYQSPLAAFGATVAVLSVLYASVVRRTGRYLRRSGYGHRWFIRDIKEADYGLPARPSIVLTKGAYIRPFFAHWLLSFLPEERFPLLNRYFGFVFVLLTVAVLVSIRLAGVFSIQQVLLGVILVLSTPQFVRPDRDYNRGFAPRKLGHILTAASLLAFFYGIASGNVGTLVLSIVLASLVHLTDRRSTEVYAVTLLLVTPLIDIRAFGILVGSFVVAVLISGGQYLRVLLAHLIDIRQGLAADEPRISTDHQDVELISNAEALSRFLKNPFAMTFFNNLSVPVSILIVIVYWQDPVAAGPLPGLFIWILASVLLWAVGSLGLAGERVKPDGFLEFAFFPSLVFVAVGWPGADPYYTLVVGTVVALGVVLIATYRFGVRLPVPSSEEPGWDELVGVLQKADKNGVFMIPPDQSRELAWETEQMIVDVLKNEEASRDQLPLVFPESRSHDLRQLRYHFSPYFAVINREVDRWEIPVPPSVTPVFRSGCFEVYRADDLIRDDWDD